MTLRLQLAVLVFPLVQAVLFGVGLLLILTPLVPMSGGSIAAMIAATALASAPIAWWIAPELSLRLSGHR